MSKNCMAPPLMIVMGGLSLGLPGALGS